MGVQHHHHHDGRRGPVDRRAPSDAADHADRWDAWLDPDSPADPALLAPPALELVERIAIRQVSPLVNRVSNNGPELLDEVRDMG